MLLQGTVEKELDLHSCFTSPAPWPIGKVLPLCWAAGYPTDFGIVLFDNILQVAVDSLFELGKQVRREAGVLEQVYRRFERAFRSSVFVASIGDTAKKPEVGKR